MVLHIEHSTVPGPDPHRVTATLQNGGQTLYSDSVLCATSAEALEAADELRALLERLCVERGATFGGHFGGELAGVGSSNTPPTLRNEKKQDGVRRARPR